MRCICYSLEDIIVVVVIEKTDVLLSSGTDTIKEIVNISFGELVGITESGQVGVELIMVLNSFDNVSFAFKLEKFLGNEGVSIMNRHGKIKKIALIFVKISRVSKHSLVIWNGPGRSRHNSKVVVSVSVNGSGERVLGAEGGSVDYYSNGIELVAGDQMCV